jgi:hypothetical protein
MGLQDAIKSLGDALQDWSRLEVLTFTGDVQVALKTGNSSEIDWENLKPQLTGGKLQLVAATRIMVDGDSVSIQTDKESPRISELLKAHEIAVSTGLSTRRAIFEFFTDNIKGLIK